MSKFQTFLVASLVLFAATSALIKVKVPPAKMMKANRRDILRQRLKAAGGCNANVCFAIDGSDRMPTKEFIAQKNFVLDLISIIAVGNPVELAAMQYADRSYPISPLTVDVEKLVIGVNDGKQRGGGSHTRSGIEFCASQLRKRKGEANKLILLGDGYTDVGRNAVRRANWFRWQKFGEISVVAAGDAAYVDIFSLAGWDETRVFEVNDFFEVLKLEEVIKKLVSSICEVGGKQGFPYIPKRITPIPWKMKARRKRWETYCKKHECDWDQSQ